MLGGGKINQPGQLSLPPGGEDNQGEGQDIQGQLAPQGQAVQGGKINCYTGTGIRKINYVGVNRGYLLRTREKYWFFFTALDEIYLVFTEKKK